MAIEAIHDRTQVRRVRLLGASADPALRVRAGTLLGGLALAPAGLLPSEVLVVRQLEDPLPGTLEIDRPDRVPVAWERAVNRSLAAVARGAARPAQGPVPAGARAVLFADRAELLACLACAARRGELASHWWWAALKLAGPEAVARAWMETPAEVPAALVLLTDEGEADGFLGWLGDATVRTLYARVAAWHGLPEAPEPESPAQRGADRARVENTLASVEQGADDREHPAAVFAAALLGLVPTGRAEADPVATALARGDLASAPHRGPSAADQCGNDRVQVRA